MHNLEDVIEKYRHELLEFSKQNSVHNTVEDNPDYYGRAVPTMAEVENTQTKAPPPIAELAIQPYKSYEDFLKRNPASGTLRVQVSAAERSFPISNAAVRVTVALPNEDKEMFVGYTDVDGIVDNIKLPAPSSTYSLEENNTVEPFALYNIYVSHPRFAPAEFKNAPVFDSVKSVQPVELVPLTESKTEPGRTIVENQPMVLFGGETQ